MSVMRRPRRHVWMLVAAAGIALVAKSAASASPNTVPGAPTCREVPRATTVEYLTGIACPPDGFSEKLGYTPQLEYTPAGWRYTRPAASDGGCSGPLADTGPFWDFAAQCRMHDYGFDLVRFGVGSRMDADAQLYRDMKASCASEGEIGRPTCKTIADSAHAVLWIGGVSPGLEPAPIG